ncbi:HAD-IA family hydrolase [Breoghania sp.]|uniref:HAD-IA family hydrolase n=1 Tax=Breoghania sp. TaxID=2065378 RepID=UPI00261A83E0|nr:HAD-IA family hydrolase [Breoghania sp.]MDJ0930260.1 HAD-IA family hydrolase [Breoghania sp.]
MVRARPRVFALASRLRRHVDIAILTNNPILLKETFAECAPEAVALFGSSAEFGARKPDPAVLRKICALHGHAPENAFLINDLRQNVDGARRAGATGIFYTNAIALETELKGLSLVKDIMPFSSRQRRARLF